jgi:PKD repeat protein
MKPIFHKAGLNLLITILSVFSLSAQDVGVSRITPPSKMTCGATSTPIQVEITNYASGSISSKIPIVMVVTGSGTFSTSDTLKRTISASGKDTITFSKKLNTQPGGTYNIKVYTNVSGDANRKNDTLTLSLKLDTSPEDPKVSDNTKCGPGTVKLVNKNKVKGAYTVWADDAAFSKIYSTNDSITPYLKATRKFYVRNAFLGKDSVTTTFKAGNSQQGNIFNVKTKSLVQVNSFDLNFTNSGVFNVEFYYKKGSFVGYDNKPSYWTKVGSTSVTCKSSGVPTHVDFGKSVTLEPNQVYGFYLRLDTSTSGNLSYTNGSGSSAGGDSFYNSDLVVYSGLGVANFFGTKFEPRIWNGTIYYQTIGCASNTILTTATIIEGTSGTDFVKGRKFQGVMSAGTKSKPDLVCAGDSLIYDLISPSIFKQSDYGTKWEVTNFTFQSPTGYSPANKVLNKPSSTSSGYLAFSATSKDLDSVYILNATVTNLSTKCDTTMTRYVVVSIHPKAAFNISPGCQSSFISFTNKTSPDPSTNAGKLVNYTWDFGNGDVSYDFNPKYAYNKPGTYKVLLRADNGSCADTISKMLTVYPDARGSEFQRPAAYNAVYNQGNLKDPDRSCALDTMVYEISSPSNFTNSDYGKSWRVTGVTVMSAGLNTIIKDTFTKAANASNNFRIGIIPPAKFTDSLLIIKVSLRGLTGGCDSTMTRILRVGTESPVASFKVANGCQSKNTAFTNTSTPSPTSAAGKLVKYTWFFDDGDTSHSINPVHEYRYPGTYKVSLVADNGSCHDSTSYPLVIYPNVLGSQFSASTLFKGLFNNGDKFNPDNACARDTLVYEITPPANFQNADYGKDWRVKSVTFMSTGLNTVFSDTFTMAADAKNNFRVGIVPPAKYADSMLVLNVVLEGIAGGCDSTMTRLLKVGTLPHADFAFDDVCEGQETTFSDLSSIKGNIYLSYSWDLGDGSSANQSNPSHTYSSPGTYDVKQTVISAFGCTDIVTKSVKVYAKPKVRYANTTACVGQPITFRDSSETEGTIVSWFWKFPNGLKRTIANPTYTFTKAGTYTITYGVSVSTGCMDTVDQIIIVNDLPKASFTYKAGCLGSPTTFTNTSTGTNLQYFWDFGNGVTSTDKNPDQTYFVSQNYTIKLTVLSDAGCTDVHTITFTPAASPKARFNYQPACVNTPMRFTDSSDYVSSFQSLKWDFGDKGTSTNGTPTHVYTAPGKYMVTLRVVNSAGCADSIQKEVEVFDAPVAAFDANTVCEGSPTAFTDKSSSSAGAISYSWNFGDNSSASTDKDPTHTYAEAGTYSVTLNINSLSCSDTKTMDVTVFKSPSATFTFKATGKKVVFTAGSTNYKSYTWYFGDGDSSNEMNPTHIYPDLSNKIVKLVVTDENGCKGEATMAVNTGIHDPNPNNYGVNIYPNPFSHGAHLDYTLDKRSLTKVVLQDMNGRDVLLIKASGMEQAGEHNLTFDASGLSSGIYILKVIVGDEVYNQRIEKLK